MDSTRPTIGFAFSGAGNRSSFYIGFLEVLQENNIPVDFISAMSGASLVAAAFACGTLPEFKDRILNLTGQELKELTAKPENGGGWYSLLRVENELRIYYTRGLRFEEVRPLMAFVTADIESGELVDLCIGDIAKAARASCTLPGVFEPVQWGNRVLVDGGILSQVPLSSLEKFSPDISIGIDMRGTKNIFSNRLITFKKFLNFFEKILFIDELESLFDRLLSDFSESEDPKQRGMFSVLGRSLDVVIEALKNENKERAHCDLMIVPDVPTAKRSEFSREISQFSYQEGRRVALARLGEIQAVVAKKTRVPTPILNN